MLRPYKRQRCCILVLRARGTFGRQAGKGGSGRRHVVPSCGRSTLRPYKRQKCCILVLRADSGAGDERIKEDRGESKKGTPRLAASPNANAKVVEMRRLLFHKSVTLDKTRIGGETQEIDAREEFRSLYLRFTRLDMTLAKYATCHVDKLVVHIASIAA